LFAVKGAYGSVPDFQGPTANACLKYIAVCSLDGNNPVDGLEIWEGKADNEWSGQVSTVLVKVVWECSSFWACSLYCFPHKYMSAFWMFFRLMH